MNRDKQIEEMAKDLKILDCLQYNPKYSIEYQRALGLHSLGYRKASDVAREIFEDIKSIWRKGRGFIKYTDLVDLERIYEKKYESEGEECDIT